MMVDSLFIIVLSICLIRLICGLFSYLAFGVWRFVRLSLADGFFQEDGIECPCGAVVRPDGLFVGEWHMPQQVVPCLCFQAFVAQSPSCIGSESWDEEVVASDFQSLLLVVLIMMEPSFVELGVFNHRLQLVHQFEAAHDGHEVVGALQRGVGFGGDDACGRVVAEGEGALEEALREVGDGGHAGQK